MTTIAVTRPASVAVPRGAVWAAAIALKLCDAWRFAWEGLRARQEATGRVADAAEVRRMALAWMEVDHRFAADLLAAADRHERGC